MGKLPETGPSLLRHLRQQQRQMVRLANTSAFARSGTAVTAEGVTTVTGTLVLQPATITATELALAAVTAPALADGSVTARALADGSVGYAALVAPTLPAAVNLTTTAFAPTSTWAEVVGLDLTVPTDCTRLLVTASAWVYAVNNSAAVDNLNARVSLGGTNGQAFLTPLPIAGFNTISAGLAVLADSLVPATTIRLKASAKTTTGTWTTDAANTATLVASLTWLR